MRLRDLVSKLIRSRKSRAIQNALALYRRGEARSDGLVMVRASGCLEIEWKARDVHPWDRAHSPSVRKRLFAEQCYADTEAAIQRLFRNCPDADLIHFKVIEPNSEDELLEGTVTREAIELCTPGRSPRTKLWQMGVKLLLIP